MQLRIPGGCGKLCRGAEKGVQSFQYARPDKPNPFCFLFRILFQNTYSFTRSALDEAIYESLTRTMGKFLEATRGCQANKHKNAWEKDIAARMICTNNAAEGPFATVWAFLHIYPTLKLRTVATLSAAIVNGRHRPAHKVSLTLTEVFFCFLRGERRVMLRMRCLVVSFKLPWTHIDLSRLMCRQGSVEENTGKRIRDIR